MIKPAVIDLSHHNTIPSSLKGAADAGILGVIHKATEGTSYVDDKLEARAFLAQDAGLLFGVYHFMRPSKVDAQVAHFLDTIDDLDDNMLLVACDYEDSAISLAELTQFMDGVKAQGFDPVLYSGHVLKEKIGSNTNHGFAQYRLWLAQYGPQAQLPAGFSRWWLWQYTDKGTVPGINPPVDLNAFDGTAVDLRNTWTGKPPQPVPEPSLDAVVITVTAPDGVPIIVNGVKII